LKKFAGIDVHKDMLVTAYRKGDSIETKSFNYDFDGLSELLGMLILNDINQVVIESTGDFYFPLYYFLSKADITVNVMNAFKVKRPEPNKTDKRDAAWLLKVGESGLFDPSYVPDDNILALRKLVRARFKMVDQIADCKRRINSLLWQLGIKLKASILKNKRRRDQFKKLLEGGDPGDLDKGLVSTIRSILGKRSVRAFVSLVLSNIAVIEALEKAVESIDSEIRAIVREYEAIIEILMSVPGVSLTLASAILSEIGDIYRFASPGKLASYAGLAPVAKESAGKTRLVGTSRKSNKYLRRYMFMAAMAAMRSNSPKIRAFSKRLFGRGKHYKVVAVAVARKMLTIIWHLLRRGTPWQEKNYSKHVKLNLKTKAKAMPINEVANVLRKALGKGIVKPKKDEKTESRLKTGNKL